MKRFIMLLAAAMMVAACTGPLTGVPGDTFYGPYGSTEVLGTHQGVHVTCRPIPVGIEPGFLQVQTDRSVYVSFAIGGTTVLEGPTGELDHIYVHPELYYRIPLPPVEVGQCVTITLTDHTGEGPFSYGFYWPPIPFL
jgi:hypothetical protein